jgi:hypothetical protein
MVPFPVGEPDVYQAQASRPVATGERLLITHGGAVTELASAQDFARLSSGYSQRVFQVSPDGRATAYLDVEGEQVRAVNAVWPEGTARVEVRGWLGDFRFSGDSRALAVLADDALTVVDLAGGGIVHQYGPAARGTWVDWSIDGPVTLQRDPAMGDAVVVLYRGVGRWTTLASSQAPITRLVAAPSSSTVAWFTEPVAAGGVSAIWRANTREPHALPTRWGSASGGTVLNAELSPDGRELAFVTGWGVFGLTEGLPESLSDDTTVHSLWYAADGALVLGSARQVAARPEWGAPFRALIGSGVRTVRLDRVRGGLVLVKDREVLHWDMRSARPTKLAVARAGERLISADHTLRGIVTWVAREASHRPRPRTKQVPSW